MSFEAVRQRVVNRLDQGDRADRGWFIITRVHVDRHWLSGIAQYIHRKVGEDWLELSATDYSRLADIAGIGQGNPGLQLRRHHLLVMDKPLRLLTRQDERQWKSIALTSLGVELATSSDPAAVLEKSLDAIRFAIEPWCPEERAQQYSAFNVNVYSVTREILAAVGGVINRDEYDLFVSRVRTDKEAKWAIDGIIEFRGLSAKERASLLSEVRQRIENPKIYQNWRDTALHTFSLFNLGSGMIRDGQHLWLTDKWVTEQASLPAPEEAEKAGVEQRLRLPEPPADEELLDPPSAPGSNVGADAESYVAKLLRSQGWRVVFYSDKRGFGFDLWARRGDRAMVVEVKSSLKELGSVTFTDNELAAAKHHQENFVLALVEHIGTLTPTVTMISNPWKVLTFVARQNTAHVVARSEWLSVAKA